MADQTGSTYISNSMTDILTFPTANLGYSTRASSQRVSTSDHWRIQELSLGGAHDERAEREPITGVWGPWSGGQGAKLP